MADIFENEAGEKFIWDGATRSFKPATPEQVQVGRAGILGQVASAIQGATGIPGMISPATGEALETVNPGSATAGLVTSLAGGAGALARQGLRRGAKETVTDRVQAKVAQQSGGRFKTDSGLIKRPGDIAPPSLQGSARGLEAGLESVPGLRILGDAIKHQRQQVVGQKLAVAMGGSADDFARQGGKIDRPFLDSMLNPVDSVYESSRIELGARLGKDKVNALATKHEKLLGKEIRQEMAEAKQNELGDILIEIRSELRADLRRSKKFRERKKINKVIEDIQKTISDALEGTDLKPQLDEADRIYKVWKTIDNSSAIAPDGSVNFDAMRRAMRKTYGSRATRGGKGINDPLAEELFRTLDDLGALGNPLPSSGTAERSIAAGIVTGGAFGLSN